jgi:hypothetical protein
MGGTVIRGALLVRRRRRTDSRFPQFSAARPCPMCRACGPRLAVEVGPCGRTQRRRVHARMVQWQRRVRVSVDGGASGHGRRKYLELAGSAAWHAWETASLTSSLFRGMAGRVYALLNFYRHSGDSIRMRRARDAACAGCGAFGGWHLRASTRVEESECARVAPGECLCKGDATRCT